mgnify:CR=1 FL=1
MAFVLGRKYNFNEIQDFSIKKIVDSSSRQLFSGRTTVEMRTVPPPFDIKKFIWLQNEIWKHHHVELNEFYSIPKCPKNRSTFHHRYPFNICFWNIIYFGAILSVKQEHVHHELIVARNSSPNASTNGKKFTKLGRTLFPPSKHASSYAQRAILAANFGCFFS